MSIKNRIGWKIAGKNMDALVKLKILGVVDGAGFSNKKRTNKALVLEIIKLKVDDFDCFRTRTKRRLSRVVTSNFHGGDTRFMYYKGKVATARMTSEHWVECAPGINFFWSMNEALDYLL